ncbi:MAG TPA: LysR family transcriptional regulator [Jatrophihabitans sp.]|nr:LysR family transcriptional regulator [Jatrophihabitans sp.]
MWLRTLSAVVEVGSFADAARHLGYTPSAVSQQMSRLERSVDVQLFNRDRRGIVPTEAAIRLAARATNLLNMLSNLDQPDGHDGPITPLRIGTCSGGLNYLRPPLRQLTEGDSLIDLSLITGDSAQLVDAVGVGNLDVAVVCRYSLVPRVWPSHLTTCLLADEPLAVLLPADHPLVAGLTITLADLEQEWWITGPEASDENTCLVRACAVAGFHPRIAARVRDWGMVSELTADGFGASLVSLGPVEPYQNAEVARLPLTGSAYRRVEIVYAATNDSPLMANFIAQLRRMYPGRPAAADHRHRAAHTRPGALAQHRNAALS